MLVLLLSVYRNISTQPKRTTPLIEPSSGQYSPVLACHRLWSRSFVNSTVACEHACGSTTGCVLEVFAVGQYLRQGCVLAPLLFNTFFAAVINLASTRFKADKGIMDALVHLRKKRGAGGSNCRKVSPRDAALGFALRWRCRGRLAITRAVEEDDGSDRVFTREGDAGVHRHIQRRGSGPGVRPDERVCIPRRKRQPKCRPVHRGRPARTQRMVQLPEVHSRTVRPTEPSPRAQNPNAKSRPCCTAASRGARARATPTRCAEPTAGSWLAASVGESTIAPTTRFPIWTRLSRREVRASRRF